MTLSQDILPVIGGLQLALDLALLVGLFILYRKVAGVDQSTWRRIADATAKALELSSRLDKNLEEKRRMVERVEKALAALEKAEPSTPSQRKERVMALLKEGRPREEIAAEVGMSLEEVELLASIQAARTAAKEWRA